jgi:hypothetical protein
MTFDDMAQRLFRLSFDPYHCIELRWGADGDERASCPDAKPRIAWYEAEQRLRNQPDRTYDAFMGFTVKELLDKPKGSGIDTPPPIDIKTLIDNIGYQVPFKPMAAVGH